MGLVSCVHTPTYLNLALNGLIVVGRVGRVRAAARRGAAPVPAKIARSWASAWAGGCGDDGAEGG